MNTPILIGVPKEGNWRLLPNNRTQPCEYFQTNGRSCIKDHPCACQLWWNTTSEGLYHAHKLNYGYKT